MPAVIPTHRYVCSFIEFDITMIEEISKNVVHMKIFKNVVLFPVTHFRILNLTTLAIVRGLLIVF